MRVGMGYDVHRLVEGRRLIIGGVPIPFEKGLLGHSDADVLLHALCDALLGGACLGDIGLHFPDTDPRFKDVSSLTLLARVRDRVRDAGFQIANVDAVVAAEAPRLSSFREKMTLAIGEVLGLEASRINIKFTTTEKLGFIGKGEGISAMCVALLEKSR
ncbi:MAG: 2-C-methyl-D-erythritol 2,4-cyclodiphosphate synthase [Desulfobacterales bacterium CG07_land_8_20_14_0_80_52_14]|nr:MAG: 2-C-methyl-D-erythritol 2,4-cyclodiphosphate synthase [Desulfobacterales bacterium CG23_combo_of_CG06-09_8_20_14_all_52_9]PIU49120.1 MAG: 2-C-methyl-D-erythritol 2,4-cyclodiphosphate synthase [Desulfobacterales bacterium CG07_land_8_20_14_0_80_52_14]